MSTPLKDQPVYLFLTLDKYSDESYMLSKEPINYPDSKPVLYHKQVRWDGDAYQLHRIYEARTKERLIDYAFKLINPDWHEDIEEEMRNKVVNNLLNGNGVWNWEWKRKGNYDFYSIFNIDKSDTHISFPTANDAFKLN